MSSIGLEERSRSPKFRPESEWAALTITYRFESNGGIDDTRATHGWEEGVVGGNRVAASAGVERRDVEVFWPGIDELRRHIWVGRGRRR
jgi:hypothetical protein